MAQRRQQCVNNSRHVVHAATPHKADSVVVKAAQSHQFILRSRCGIRPIWARERPSTLAPEPERPSHRLSRGPLPREAGSLFSRQWLVTCMRGRLEGTADARAVIASFVVNLNIG